MQRPVAFDAASTMRGTSRQVSFQLVGVELAANHSGVLG
jgi:hypothetical protein